MMQLAPRNSQRSPRQQPMEPPRSANRLKAAMFVDAIHESAKARVDEKPAA